MHTALGFQNPMGQFHKHFQPSSDCTVIKKACPASFPCHASPVQQPTGCLANSISKRIWTKSNPTKPPAIFRWVCALIHLTAWPCDCRCWGWDDLTPLGGCRVFRRSGNKDKETFCVLRACYKVHITWEVSAATSNLFCCL